MKSKIQYYNLIFSKLFEKTWGLKKFRIIKILQERNERIVGLIHSTSGEYVFKTAGKWQNERGVKKDTAVFDALQKRGFRHIPKLIKTRNGEDFVSFKGKFIYLLEYINGKRPKPSIKTYEELGRITATLHSTKDFPFKTDFDTARIIRDLCKNSRKYKFGSQFRKIALALPDFKKFSQTVIHTDIAPSNSIQKKSNEIVLVDWDGAGIGPTVVDLGGVLNEIIKDKKLNVTNVQAFYRSYFSKRRISRQEISHIFDGCLFFALFYMQFGNIKKRWERILWMVENRAKIESVYK